MTPEPGWYANPGPQDGERYWDGNAWGDKLRQGKSTYHSPLASEVAPTSAAAQGGGGNNKGGGGGHTILKVMLGVILGVCVLIGGCVALVGAGLNSTETEGITRSQFDSVSQGDTQSEIEDRFGEPEDSQDFEQQIPELQDAPSRSSCIYYQEKGKKILEGSSFQLCFDDGKLSAKNAY